MKFIKKIGVIALVLLVCFVMLILVLEGFASQWQANIKLLSVEEVRRSAVTPSAPGPTSSDAPKPQSLAQPEHQANYGANEEGVRPGGELSGSPEVAVKTESTSSPPPHPTRLSSQPTDEQVRKGLLPYFLDDDIWKARIRAFTRRIVGSVVWTVRQGETDDSTCGIPGSLGRLYLCAQDFDTARDFLREAVRVEKDKTWRRYLCGTLAWLEDDPQVAAALLEQSCAGPVPIDVPYNALNLCIATGSEALAEYYYQRYSDSWQHYLGKLPFDPFGETTTWLQERLARDKPK